MQAARHAAPASRTALWAGRVISALAVVFLLFDALIHTLAIQPVVDSFAQLGYPVSVSAALGILELVCVALYVIPQTSILGAILLTGYLGGAVSAQVRIEASLFGNVLFPVYVGLMVWGGLYLRDYGLRTLIPLRRSAPS